MLVAVLYTISLAFFLHIERGDLPAYATIWAGTLALFGGWLTVRAIRDQIQNNLDMENAKSEKMARAARSVLPLALTEISNMAAGNLARHFKDHDIHDVSLKSSPLRSLESSTLEILKECIFSSPDDVSARLAKIIAMYQVLHTRAKDTTYEKILSGDGKPTLDQLNSIDNAIGWAVLHSLASSLFDFARAKPDFTIAAIDRELAMRSFFISGIMPDIFDNLEKIITDRAAKSRLEWK